MNSIFVSGDIVGNTAKAPKVDGYSKISFWREGPVGIVTILSPGTIDKSLVHELISVLSIAAVDYSVKSLVLTGSNFIFSKGLSLPQSRTYADLRDYYESLKNLILFFISLEKPIFAAINGTAINNGLFLALLCDEVFHSENSKIVIDDKEPHLLLSSITLPLKISSNGEGIVLKGIKVDADDMMKLVLANAKELTVVPYHRKRRFDLTGFENMILQEEIDFLDFYLWCQGCGQENK